MRLSQLNAAVSAVCLAALAGCSKFADVMLDLPSYDQGAEQGAALDRDVAMRVEIPAKGKRATVYLLGEYQDVQEWRSLDGVGLQTRSGILIGTSGFGPDLMGNDSSKLLAALSGGAADYQRSIQVLAADGRVLSASFNCQMMQNRDLTYSEICAGEDSSSFRNNYTLDNEGNVVDSQQWMGSAVGYLVLKRVDSKSGPKISAP